MENPMLSTSKNLDLDTGSGCSNVPKSHSSSSGVNDISGDSVSSTNSKEDLSGIKSKKDDPTFNDVLDLLKFSYILQVCSFFCIILQSLNVCKDLRGISDLM